MNRTLSIARPISKHTEMASLWIRTVNLLRRLTRDLNRYVDASHKVHVTEERTGADHREGRL